MSDSNAVISGIEAMRGVGQQRAKGFWADVWDRVLRRRAAVLALAWIGIVAAGAVLAPLVANAHPLRFERLDAADPQPVAAPTRRADAPEAPPAAAAHAQDAGVLGIDFVDVGQHADVLQFDRLGRTGRARLRSRAQADDAERRARAQAFADQVEVTRLEDLQPEQPLREQHRAQREERQRVGKGGRGPTPVGGAVVLRTRRKGLVGAAAHSRPSSSRWRTSAA